jgi:hypothetical protein
MLAFFNKYEFVLLSTTELLPIQFVTPKEIIRETNIMDENFILFFMVIGVLYISKKKGGIAPPLTV